MQTILTVIGTRPEAIKLFPILKAINESQHFKNEVCISGQHTDLIELLLIKLGIIVNYRLKNIGDINSLTQKMAIISSQLEELIPLVKPNLVIVQGDTTTAFASALAAFYKKVPIAHIEAGLRTNNLHSPWPEEAHRCLIDKLTTYFFAPTLQSYNTLLAEGAASDKVWLVGNTSIDAIKIMPRPTKSLKNQKLQFILVTIHRRENHGRPLENICKALKAIARLFANIRIKVFLHPNPAVTISLKKLLSGITNISLLQPVDHFAFVKLLHECIFIITDSGGIQEEAPALGKPVLIIRDTTERPEGIEAGTARLVGTCKNNIIKNCKELLKNPETLDQMSKIHFPYGDGFAAERIVDILDKELNRVHL